MTEADSFGFSALERQMEQLRGKVEKHSELVSSIGAAAAKVRGGWTRFTASEKETIEEELRTAEMCARQLYDKGLLSAEIAYAQGLVQEAYIVGKRRFLLQCHMLFPCDCILRAEEETLPRHFHDHHPYKERSRKGVPVPLYYSAC